MPGASHLTPSQCSSLCLRLHPCPSLTCWAGAYTSSRPAASAATCTSCHRDSVAPTPPRSSQRPEGHGPGGGLSLTCRPLSCAPAPWPLGREKERKRGPLAPQHLAPQGGGKPGSSQLHSCPFPTAPSSFKDPVCSAKTSRHPEAVGLFRDFCLIPMMMWNSLAPRHQPRLAAPHVPAAAGQSRGKPEVFLPSAQLCLAPPPGPCHARRCRDHPGAGDAPWHRWGWGQGQARRT